MEVNIEYALMHFGSHVEGKYLSSKFCIGISMALISLFVTQNTPCSL